MGDTDLRTQVGQLRIRCVDVVCPGRSRSLWPNPSVVRAATPRLELLLGSSAIWVRMKGDCLPCPGSRPPAEPHESITGAAPGARHCGAVGRRRSVVPHTGIGGWIRESPPPRP